jgi:hypothetical protein
MTTPTDADRALAKQLFEPGKWVDETELAQIIADHTSKVRGALDQCPWPEDVWPNTIEETGKAMREAMGDLKTTAASGVLMRHAWRLAQEKLNTA